jgi:peptidoglycan/xylan/chitin deacetylase (PgdA/CDA1 family)
MATGPREPGAYNGRKRQRELTGRGGNNVTTSLAVTRRAANILRRPARLVCKTAARLRPKRTIVLAYHSIGEAKDAVRPDRFEEQMSYLKHEARVISLDSILAGNHLDNDALLTCAITFDDGYSSVYDIAYPVLRHYGFPAVAYITTDAVGELAPKRSDDYPGLFPGETTLTWPQIRELNRHEVVIGSHLCQHKNMTRLDAAEGLSELTLSKALITRKLNSACRHFAYPFGLFNRQTVEWVRNSGYESATTVMHATVPREYNHLTIPRMCVAPIHTLDDFAAILRGEFDYLPIMQTARRLLGLKYSL